MLWLAMRPVAVGDGVRDGTGVDQWELDKPRIKSAIFESLEDALQWQPLTLRADVEPQQLALLGGRPWLLAPPPARVFARRRRRAADDTFHQSLRLRGIDDTRAFKCWMPRAHQARANPPMQRVQVRLRWRWRWVVGDGGCNCNGDCGCRASHVPAAGDDDWRLRGKGCGRVSGEPVVLRREPEGGGVWRVSLPHQVWCNYSDGGEVEEGANASGGHEGSKQCCCPSKRPSDRAGRTQLPAWPTQHSSGQLGAAAGRARTGLTSRSKRASSRQAGGQAAGQPARDAEGRAGGRGCVPEREPALSSRVHGELAFLHLF